MKIFHNEEFIVPRIRRFVQRWGMPRADCHANLNPGQAGSPRLVRGKGKASHYELEFIHPFTDGNGRIGRLWQTLILSQWNPLFARLQVESVIHRRQAEYYRVLGLCNKAGQSTAFIEFMLDAILGALRELDETDQVADQVSDQVTALLRVLAKHTRSALDCMKQLKLTHRPTFRVNYLGPALEAGLIERTVPNKPNSRLQKYRLTEKGRAPLP